MNLTRDHSLGGRRACRTVMLENLSDSERRESQGLVLTVGQGSTRFEIVPMAVPSVTSANIVHAVLQRSRLESQGLHKTPDRPERARCPTKAWMALERARLSLGLSRAKSLCGFHLMSEFSGFSCGTRGGTQRREPPSVSSCIATGSIAAALLSTILDVVRLTPTLVTGKNMTLRPASCQTLVQ